MVKITRLKIHTKAENTTQKAGNTTQKVKEMERDIRHAPSLLVILSRLKSGSIRDTTDLFLVQPATAS